MRGLLRGGLLLAGLHLIGPAMAVDIAIPPPPHERLDAPGGRYSFDISVAPPGAPGLAIGTLRRRADAGSVLVWQHTLAQPVRPRFAVLADDGTVVLFARWENVLDGIAVQVLDPTGAETRAYSIDDISTLLGLPRSAIAPMARYGAWIDRLPVLGDGRVTVGVAGRTLAVALRGGALTVLP